jgi:hypothetical protein
VLKHSHSASAHATTRLVLKPERDYMPGDDCRCRKGIIHILKSCRCRYCAMEHLPGSARKGAHVFLCKVAVCPNWERNPKNGRRSVSSPSLNNKLCASTKRLVLHNLCCSLVILYNAGPNIYTCEPCTMDRGYIRTDVTYLSNSSIAHDAIFPREPPLVHGSCCLWFPVRYYSLRDLLVIVT